MPWFHRILMGAIVALTAPAAASIEPDEVVLVFNSADATSRAIHDAYMSIHPDVHVLDINVDYDVARPLPLFISDRYVTPEAYVTFIRDPLLDFLEDHPEVIAVQTTRGLPALIVEASFVQDVFAGGHHEQSGVRGSLESKLMVAGLRRDESLTDPIGLVENPYRFALGMPLGQFLDETCSRGALLAASRLDSSRGRGGQSNVEAIIELIERSASLDVMTSEAVIVADGNSLGGGTLFTNGAFPTLLESGWSIAFDSTDAFLHGTIDENDLTYDCANGPPRLLDDELAYVDCHELAHITLGATGYDQFNPDLWPECVHRHYIRDYRAHPAGYFWSTESYSGQTVHTLRRQTVALQGAALDWIGYSKGSFTIAHTYGPSGLNVRSEFVLLNLYEHGMSWGEAALAAMSFLDSNETPIGDVMARVNVSSGDRNADGMVDGTDLALAIRNAAMAPRTNFAAAIDDALRRFAGSCDLDAPTFDHDELLSNRYLAAPSCAVFTPGGERLLCLDAATCDPLMHPEAIGRCVGDLDGDGAVNQVDVAIIGAMLGCACPLVDFASDGAMVTNADVEAVAAMAGAADLVALFDLTDDGMVDCADLSRMLTARRAAFRSDQFVDVTCDGVEDDVDFAAMLAYLKSLHVNGVPTNTLGDDQTMAHNCNDVLAVMDRVGRATDAQVLSTYDLDADGDIDATDVAIVWAFEIDSPFIYDLGPPFYGCIDEADVDVIASWCGRR